MSILEIISIKKLYQSTEILKCVNLKINTGEFIALIGLNGAGKTTLFDIIIGLKKSDNGKILYNNIDISNMQTHEIAKLGIVKTSQNPRPFNNLNVIENVIIALLHGRKPVKKLSEAKSIAETILQKLNLYDKRSFVTTNLNMPELRKLELAKIIAVHPKIILLDEVMAGLDTGDINEIKSILKDMKKNGLTILMTEHSINKISDICERGIVLHNGQIITDDTINKVLNDESIKSFYLGK